MANNTDKTKLQQDFETIRDERTTHANTARRIGNAFLSLLNYADIAANDKLSAVNDDTAHGLITFLKGIKISKLFSFDQNGNIITHTIASDDYSENNQRGFTIARNVDGSYRLCLSEIQAWGMAALGSLLVKGNTTIGGNTSIGGDTTMGGTVSSPDFASGFLSGKGWRIASVPTTNAAGETEQKATAELDNIIVRGTLRIFEMVVSQLLGENDNRIFSAMLEVDHYDPATGKVYLDTQEGKMLNPFRPDDCIMVQQYSGMPSADNKGYISKAYELIIDEVGSEGEGEKMLAWVTFHGFTSTIEDATPEALIQKRDTFVRVDNLTDPDRKGIIEMMTVGTDTPYIDIIHGLKTDPAGALKGRLGNLQGIIHPLFGALRGFGEYLQNLYATGDFILRRTGESIDTKIQMLQNQFATRFSQTSYEASEEQNYLHNGQFLQATGSTDDALLIDGWQIDEGEDAQFWVDANGMPVMVNRELTTSGNHKVQIDNCEGRNVLHIISSGISQANALIKQPGTHTEYTQPQADATDTTAASREVQDTLYIMARVYANTASRLTIGFSGCTEVSGKTNTLTIQTLQLAATGDWQTINLQGTWNGTGHFQLKADGNLLIEQVIITDEPLANLAKTVSTQIQQTATNIKLLGENISKVDGKTTQLGIDINAQDKSIRQYVDEKDEQNRQDTSSAITLTAEGINATVEEVKETANNNSSSIAKLQQTAKDITISVTEVETAAGTAQSTAEKAQASADNAQGAADKAQASADNAQGAADKAQSAADTAQADAEKANTSISKLQVSVNEISATVGKAATADDLMEVDTRLSGMMADQKKKFSSDIEILGNHIDDVDQEIRNDYATTITKVQQYSDSWSVAAGAFDKNGNLVQCSGETIDTHFANLFAQKIKTDDAGNITNISKSGLLVTDDKTELETKISTVDGKVVEKATISTMITDGISQATITANQIKLEGAVTANDYFKINTDGSMEAKSGKIGCLTINSDGTIVEDGMKISNNGMLFYHVGTDAGYGPDNFWFKINTDSSFNPIAEIEGCNCPNGAMRIGTYRNGDYEYPCIPLVLSAGAGFHPALKIESGYIHDMRGDVFSFTSSVYMNDNDHDSGSTIFLNNTSAIKVYLPTDPMSGQYYRFIKNGSDVTFYGYGKNIALKGRTDLLSSYSNGTARAWIECIYDGEKWFINF